MSKEKQSWLPTALLPTSYSPLPTAQATTAIPTPMLES